MERLRHCAGTQTTLRFLRLLWARVSEVVRETASEIKGKCCEPLWSTEALDLRFHNAHAGGGWVDSLRSQWYAWYSHVRGTAVLRSCSRGSCLRHLGQAVRFSRMGYAERGAFHDGAYESRFRHPARS